MTKTHPVAFASLAAAVERALARPKPITYYGCRPLTPPHPPEAKLPCKVCGRRPGATGPPAHEASDHLICGECHRASPRIERVCQAQLRADHQRQHLIQHNRQLTAGTPRPPILDEPSSETKPPERKRRIAHCA